MCVCVCISTIHAFWLLARLARLQILHNRVMKCYKSIGMHISLQRSREHQTSNMKIMLHLQLDNIATIRLCWAWASQSLHLYCLFILATPCSDAPFDCIANARRLAPDANILQFLHIRSWIFKCEKLQRKCIGCRWRYDEMMENKWDRAK